MYRQYRATGIDAREIKMGHCPIMCVNMSIPENNNINEEKNATQVPYNFLIKKYVENIIAELINTRKKKKGIVRPPPSTEEMLCET